MQVTQSKSQFGLNTLEVMSINMNQERTVVAVHKRVALKLLQKGYGVIGRGCSGVRARCLGIHTSKRAGDNECAAFQDYTDCHKCPAFFWIVEHGCGSQDLKENNLL